METLTLRLSLAGLDSPDVVLRQLQRQLQDVGVRVERVVELPAEEELGGRVTALLLVFTLVSESSHLPTSVAEGLQYLHEWQQQSQQVKPIIQPTGQKKVDEELEQMIRREQLHIELREPEPPPKKKESVVAPPPPKPSSEKKG